MNATVRLYVLLALGWVSSLWSAPLVTLAWDPSPDTNVTSYRIYAGTQVDIYSSVTNAGTNLTVTIIGLAPGTWFFVVTARNDLTGLESDPSNVVWKTIGTNPPPAPPLKSIRISSTLESSNNPLGPWRDEISLMTQELPLPSTQVFWRSRVRYELIH